MLFAFNLCLNRSFFTFIFAVLLQRMVKAFVWSVALYGSETWTLRKEDIRRLETFEIWIWRRMMKVPWTEHKTNEEILKMVETERIIMDTVRSRQKRWL